MRLAQGINFEDLRLRIDNPEMLNPYFGIDAGFVNPVDAGGGGRGFRTPNLESPDSGYWLDTRHPLPLPSGEIRDEGAEIAVAKMQFWFGDYPPSSGATSAPMKVLPHSIKAPHKRRGVGS